MGDTILFIAMVVEFENNYSTLEGCIKTLRKKLKIRHPDLNIIGEHKYYAMMTCIGPTDSQFESVVRLINENTCKSVDPGTYGAYDEHMLAYFASTLSKEKAEMKRSPIPVMWIQRKPHPNGLMMYKLCVQMQVSNKSYILLIIPHMYQPALLSPTESLLKALKIFRQYYPTQQFHITADAAFGSEYAMNEISSLNMLATFSMSTVKETWLWKLLERKTYDGRWKAVTNHTGVMFSVQRNNHADDPDNRYHHLLSNAFNVETTSPRLNRNPAANVRYNKSYSRSYLNSQSVKSLREICKKEKIVYGSLAREDLILKILKICNPSTEESQMNELILNTLDDNQYSEKAPHHDHYRATFNLIDKQNKYYYKAPYRHKVNNWRTKMLLGVLNELFYDAFVIMNEFERIHYGDFRSELQSTLYKMAKAYQK